MKPVHQNNLECLSKIIYLLPEDEEGKNSFNNNSEVYDFKRQIQLYEASTDKIIAINPMRKKPKLIKLKAVFRDLFEVKGEPNKQSNQETIARLRERMS